MNDVLYVTKQVDEIVIDSVIVDHHSLFVNRKS